MSHEIFISYRRKDDPGYTEALFGRLEAEFPGDSIFYDVESIPTGQNFVRVLNDMVEQCDVLLAVIGPEWLSAKDAKGNFRLNDEKDFVRIEIAAGLRLGKRVMPVLVNGADMPRVDTLPDDLKPLIECQAQRLVNETFKQSCQTLVSDIRDALADAEVDRKRKVEDLRRQREAEEEKQRAAEERLKRAEAERRAEEERRQTETARLKLLEKFTPEDLRKQEELLDWETIKSSKRRSDVIDHLEKYPNGITRRAARARLAEFDWAALGENPDRYDLANFVDIHGDSEHAEEASQRVRDFDEAEAWELAKDEGSIAGWTEYLEIFSDSDNAPEARAELNKLQEERDHRLASAGNDADQLEAFLEVHPAGKFALETKERIKKLRAEETDWNAARSEGTIAKIMAFQKRWPTGKFSSEAQALLQKKCRGELTAAKQKKDLRALKDLLGLNLPTDLAAEVEKVVAANPEEAAWSELKKAPSLGAIDNFLKTHANSVYAAQAKSLRRETEAKTARQKLGANPSRAQLKQFTVKYAGTASASSAQSVLDDSFLRNNWLKLIFTVAFAAWLFVPNFMSNLTPSMLLSLWQSSPNYMPPYIYSPPPYTPSEPTPSPEPAPEPEPEPIQPEQSQNPEPAPPANCWQHTDPLSCISQPGCTWGPLMCTNTLPVN